MMGDVLYLPVHVRMRFAKFRLASLNPSLARARTRLVLHNNLN